jgi:hypothetical protein
MLTSAVLILLVLPVLYALFHAETDTPTEERTEAEAITRG